MDVFSHELWQIFEQKNQAMGHECADEFKAAVRKICQHGITLSKTIQITFKTYTLHDETHICNVMTKMLALLGGKKDSLTRDECAMLVMAACCHDIGMSAADEEKTYLRSCPDCMQTFLEEHPADYNVAYAGGTSGNANITDEILCHYIRAHHHDRVAQQLESVEWPPELGRFISVDQLIAVCKSHGEDPRAIRQLQVFAPDLDLYLCAVLLRLGDILDFDATRAPDVLYRYINLAQLDGMENELSRIEWQKHQASRGFTLDLDEARQLPLLLYRAECTNIQVEQAIAAYLNWVDRELAACAEQIRYMSMRWRSLMLPGKVMRQLVPKGYLSGEYKLTLDQERVVELLIGRELYSDPAIFVRELIQNAIDAIRTRKQMDKGLSRSWSPRINISTWIDSENYYWFRIEDNGIGMTDEAIQKYFLKIGHSYYGSDQFKADKIRCEADLSYKPISRFGIGLLSCFMGDSKHNRVEVTTKHFPENGRRYPAYRLSIQGINGYYYLADDSQHRTTAPDMPSAGGPPQKFIAEPGTIIAVRTNLFQSGGVRTFKEIIDKYVVYPEVPIHYEGIEGVCDYKTEQEFMDAVHKLTPRSAEHIYQPVETIPVSPEALQMFQQDYPEVSWEEPPVIFIYCVPLDHAMGDPFITGASVIIKAEGKAVWQTKELDKKYAPKVELSIHAGSGMPGGSIDVKVSFGLPAKAAQELRQHVSSAVQDEYGQLGINMEDDALIYMLAGSSHTSLDKLSGIAREELHILEALTFRYPFISCNNALDQIAWFQTWFSRYFDPRYHYEQKHYSLNIHNGILADGSQLLPFSISAMSCTTLLLKDEYCPHLTLSRDDIQGLPLSAACSLDVLTHRIQNDLTRPNYLSDLHYLSGFYDRIDFRLIPMKNYLEVLEKKPRLSSYLLFSTELGMLSVSDISDALQKKDSIDLTAFPVRGLPITVLMQHFDLKLKSFYRTSIQCASLVCVTKKSTASALGPLEAFPPALFLPPASDGITAFSCSSRPNGGTDPPYNAKHPFSQWLIGNQAELQRNVPGIYRQLISRLLYNTKCIESLNSILSQLRRVPHLKIPFPADLTENDLAILPPIADD